LFTPSGVKITDLRKNKRLIKLNKSLKRQQRKLSRSLNQLFDFFCFLLNFLCCLFNDLFSLISLLFFLKPQTEGIGIDLGLKDTLFTPSGVKITDLRKNKRLSFLLNFLCCLFNDLFSLISLLFFLKSVILTPEGVV
jgi:hypothetical protein